MKKTPPGTRALIKKFLKDDTHWDSSEISKRVGSGNSVVVSGKVITAFASTDPESPISNWVSVSNRIQLDNEDDKIPEVESPFDGIEEDEEDDHE